MTRQLPTIEGVPTKFVKKVCKRVHLNGRHVEESPAGFHRSEFDTTAWDVGCGVTLRVTTARFDATARFALSTDDWTCEMFYFTNADGGDVIHAFKLNGLEAFVRDMTAIMMLDV